MVLCKCNWFELSGMGLQAYILFPKVAFFWLSHFSLPAQPLDNLSNPEFQNYLSNHNEQSTQFFFNQYRYMTTLCKENFILLNVNISKVTHILIPLQNGLGPTGLLEFAYDFYGLIYLHEVDLWLLHMLLSHAVIP